MVSTEGDNDVVDGDFSSLEALLARPGLLKPQSQKAFLYLCYRQQFLEHVENRTSSRLYYYRRQSNGEIDRPVSQLTHRRVPESLQPTIQTIETSRTLPTHPIRLLLALIPHIRQYSARCPFVPELGRRGS